MFDLSDKDAIVTGAGRGLGQAMATALAYPGADIPVRISAGRWGGSLDLGGAAVFPSSSASDHVHGTVLLVDGGWLAR